MLKQLTGMCAATLTLSSPTRLPPLISSDRKTLHHLLSPAAVKPPLRFNGRVTLGIFRQHARRRVRYEEDDEWYGYNEEIAALEMYTQMYREEALIVRAMVDEHQVEVLIFKGFSSCLSQGTATDPSTSMVPQRAVIKSIDRIKGPFDPSNIDYLEKGLSWEAFQSSLPSTK